MIFTILGADGSKCRWEGHISLDFANLEKVESGTSGQEIYVNLNSDLGRIKHTFAPADLCCKLPPPGFAFDGIDEVSF